MSKFKGIIYEKGISAANHTAGNPITIGEKIRKITIKNLLTGSGNVRIGWSSGDGANLIIPGESVTYSEQDMLFDDNQLYLSFTDVAAGQALVSIIREGEEIC
jgi:hypothetical protein